MRKSLLLAAAAAVVLAGCGQDDVVNSGVDQNNGTPIEFRTLTNKTRTTEMDINNIGDFRVSAVWDKDGTVFPYVMENMAVTRTIASANTGTWTYSPIKYFPNNADDVSFFAYSPSGSVNVASFGATSATAADIVYTVPEKASAAQKAEDFLVATANVEKDDYGSSIIMNFKHALSIANFSAKNTSEGATFTITKVELTDLANKGTLTAATTGLSWGSRGVQNVIYEAALPGAGVSILPGGTSAVFKGLTSANEGLMILPQEILATSKLKITYGAVDGEYKDIYPAGTTLEFDIPEISAGNPFIFVEGKKYAFKFTFDALYQIKFDIDVADWGTENEVFPTPPPIIP